MYDDSELGSAHRQGSPSLWLWRWPFTIVWMMWLYDEQLKKPEHSSAENELELRADAGLNGRVMVSQ